MIISQGTPELPDVLSSVDTRGQSVDQTADKGITNIATSSLAATQQKVILFNDTSAWYHWGCTGTSLSLKEGIEKLGLTLQAVPINETSKLKVPEVQEFASAEKYGQFCAENSKIVTAIQEADAVVITGEGTIHGVRGPKALLYIAHIAKNFLGKHVEIINHSAYPYSDPSQFTRLLEDAATQGIQSEAHKRLEEAQKKLDEGQRVYRNVYDRLDFVAIREPLSKQEMEKIQIPSTLSFDCLPLYIRDHYHTPKQANRTLVVSGGAGLSKTEQERLCQYLDLMADLEFDIKVLIGAAAFPSKGDPDFAKFLQENCEASIEITTAASMDEWLDTINHASLLVSGRFHHSIAAFCLNTPFIAMGSNTPKLHGISKLLALPEPLSSSDPQLVEKLLSRTAPVLRQPEVNNVAKVSVLHELAERNFDGLKAWMEPKQ